MLTWAAITAWRSPPPSPVPSASPSSWACCAMSTASTAERLRSAVAGLFPGYFALVMATGIVSIASQMLGYPAIARPLLPVNIVFYVVLVALTVFRLAAYPARFLADLSDHARGSGFF